MPRTKAVEVYQFSELSNEAKERARDRWREHDDFSDTVEYERFETAAKLLGIDLTEQRTNRKGQQYEANTIQWTGFSSQGDGASFTGTYTFISDSTQAIREEFGTDTKLWAIADGLMALHCRMRLLHGGWLAGRITKDGRYVHKYTMDATAYNSLHEDEEEYSIEVSKEFLELMRDFAQWIYDGLESEYDYRMSDEAIDESIEGNECEFYEDGSMV